MRSKFFSVLAVITISLSLGSRVHAVSQATGLNISPTKSTITADERQSFTVTTTNADGTTSDVTSTATFSMNDPRGAMTGSMYSAGKVGTWTVLASYQSFNVTALVNVTAGAVADLDVNPNSDPEYTTVGKKVQFEVDGFDAHQNNVGQVIVSWSVIGPIGTISQSGVFTPTTIGTGKVQAQSGTITKEVAVVVSAAPVESTTNGNINGTTNTNKAVTNTNASVVNNNSNTDVPVITVSSQKDESTTCRTLSSWAWILVLVLALASIAALYWFIPATKFWPVVLSLVVAAALAYIQRHFGCSLYSWWAGVMIIGTVAISLFALRQTPPKQPPTL